MPLLFLISGLNVISLILIFLFRPKNKNDNQLLQNQLQILQSHLEKIESGIKNDFRTNREESATISKDNRTELNNTLKEFKSELGQTLKIITDNSQSSLTTINKTLETKIDGLMVKVDDNNRANRDELSKNLTQAKMDNKQMREEQEVSFKNFQIAFDRNVQGFNDLQKEKFSQLEFKQLEMINNTEAKLNLIKNTVEEKLEKTLSERLGQSFETVGKQLIEVQKGLGEMQSLANDVGGLKKVLSNVKMRGGLGEVQLEMLLEQILAPDQYEKNVKTKAESSDLVEFAIKLPGRGEGQKASIWLPIDAKFPKDVYENLQTAYDIGDLAQIESAQKTLDTTIKSMAKDISSKYIDPPNTTDFGIMFLPFEGIYAEVVRKASLLEELQRTYKIIVTGPTTLAAILNSLHMGFKTLAIEKRSSEVWQVLGSVKKEFESFGGLLQKAQTNIKTGLGQLDDVMGVRTRAIQRKLVGVESLVSTEADVKIAGPSSILLTAAAEDEI